MKECSRKFFGGNGYAEDNYSVQMSHCNPQKIFIWKLWPKCLNRSWGFLSKVLEILPQRPMCGTPQQRGGCFPSGGGFDFGPYLVDGWQGGGIDWGEVSWTKGPVARQTTGAPILLRAFFKKVTGNWIGTRSSFVDWTNLRTTLVV